jgi:hypothetical protein
MRNPMAKFTLRQSLALTTLFAVWFATFNPEQLGLFVHIALGYLFAVGYLAANRYGLRFLGPLTCFISRSTTAACSLWWLFLIPIVFQADTSRREHWEMFFECITYLAILIFTLGAAEWVRRQSRKLEAHSKRWLLNAGLASIVYGIAMRPLIIAEDSYRDPDDNLVLGIVLLNAAYLVAYAMPTSRQAFEPQLVA